MTGHRGAAAAFGPFGGRLNSAKQHTPILGVAACEKCERLLGVRGDSIRDDLQGRERRVGDRIGIVSLKDREGWVVLAPPSQAAVMILRARAFVNDAGRPRPSRGIDGRLMGPGWVNSRGNWVLSLVLWSWNVTRRASAAQPFCRRTSMKSPSVIERLTVKLKTQTRTLH